MMKKKKKIREFRRSKCCHRRNLVLPTGSKQPGTSENRRIRADVDGKCAHIPTDYLAVWVLVVRFKISIVLIKYLN